MEKIDRTEQCELSATWAGACSAMVYTSEGGPWHWWMEQWAGSVLRGPVNTPAKHRGLTDPTHVLDGNVAHARGARIEAGGGCCPSTGVLWLTDGCVLQI